MFGEDGIVHALLAPAVVSAGIDPSLMRQIPRKMEGRRRLPPIPNKTKKPNFFKQKGPRGRVIWGREERTIRLGPVRLLPAPNNPFLFPDSTRPRCV